MTVANEHGATLALIGDRAQLPAIGRGGVLNMAVAAHPRPLDLSELHRFREPGYADLTLRMRDRESPKTLFDELAARGNIVVHSSADDAWAAIASDVAAHAVAGASVAVAVATNEQAAELNALVQTAHADAGRTRKPAVEVAGIDELTLRVGDRMITRKNNTDLAVTNRDTWTVGWVHRDGLVSVSDGARKARLPRTYVEESTHLAYAATEYGVQGATVDHGHGVVTDSSSAQAVYVAATRGREHNTLHIVATGRDEARDVFVTAMNREAGDRGTEAARLAAHSDIDGVVLPVLDHDPAVRAARLAVEERVWRSEMRGWEAAQERWQNRNPEAVSDEYPTVVDAAEHAAADATTARELLERETSAAAVTAGELQWSADYTAVREAEAAVASASVFRRAAVQKAVETVRNRFQNRHKAVPAAMPGEAQRAGWARTAVAAGANSRLDAARVAEQAAIAKRAQLHANPPPAGGQPVAPRPGTAEQETGKDAAYQTQRANEDRQQEASNDYASRTARTEQQSVDTSSAQER